MAQLSQNVDNLLFSRKQEEVRKQEASAARFRMSKQSARMQESNHKQDIDKGQGARKGMKKATSGVEEQIKKKFRKRIVVSLLLEIVAGVTAFMSTIGWPFLLLLLVIIVATAVGSDFINTSLSLLKS
ncbi:hypothetical protein COV04_00180 [Candidatus Uhrbacteria bacterium CG10_big_fil_rev_8_21_14_0_10_48_11]|uniref:Uncharacterized protein n=1 Tax=Candidatus Uhrbacteria bacterium CG10_big_fil_rev_8_21_14_0_10_48_11 TaxID=1975037 RepID=A0A2M8LFY7_9BACT|nr:MAG: hypothetical protein COV04_00180 [Candidatus Uhrbacteria bacterium CG10_big_fil_rev_8_21_14_0_10_48_11]